MSDLKTVRNTKIQLEIGGKLRSLHYDLNAFAELEEAFGNLSEITEKLTNPAIKDLRKLLWAGFIHEDEKLKEKEVGSWFTFTDIKLITDKITDALFAAIPVDETKDVGETDSKNVLNQAQ